MSFFVCSASGLQVMVFLYFPCNKMQWKRSLVVELWRLLLFWEGTSCKQTTCIRLQVASQCRTNILSSDMLKLHKSIAPEKTCVKPADIKRQNSITTLRNLSSNSSTIDMDRFPLKKEVYVFQEIISKEMPFRHPPMDLSWLGLPLPSPEPRCPGLCWSSTDIQLQNHWHDFTPEKQHRTPKID